MIKTVESLESHGAEYIDTGIAVIPGRKIVVDFEFIAKNAHELHGAGVLRKIHALQIGV